MSSPHTLNAFVTTRNILRRGRPVPRMARLLTIELTICPSLDLAPLGFESDWPFDTPTTSSSRFIELSETMSRLSDPRYPSAFASTRDNLNCEFEVNVAAKPVHGNAGLDSP
jgi:hypothetical protein